MSYLSLYSGIPLTAERIMTKNLILETPDLKYAEDLFITVSDKSVAKEILQPLDSLDSVKSHIEDLIYRGQEGKVAAWLIIDQTSQKAIGAIRLRPVSNDEYAIGYFINKDFQGKGFATESVEAVVNYAKSKGLKSLTADITASNIASMKVLEKNGFKKVEEPSMNPIKKLLKFKF